MGSGILGTNLYAGHGFFGFDPTPNTSLVNTARGAAGSVSSGQGYSGWAPDTNSPLQAQQTAAQVRGEQAPGPSISSGPAGGANASTGAVGGAGSSGSNLAGYDQAIGNTNSAIDRLGSQFNSGNSAIDASYTNALNQLLLGRNQSQQSYDTSKQQTAQDYIGAKNTIGANAGASLQGLQRLLGSRGAGGSSAYNTVAPEAVGRQATLQRADAGNQFGQNNQALDTGWNNYQTGYNNSVADVGAQRDQQRQGLQSNIETNRASLLQTLAQLSAQRGQAAGGNGVADAQPYLNQANDVLNGLASYNTAPINYQTQAYSAPELGSYAQNPQAAPTFQGQAPTNDYFSPYLAALLGKRQQGQM